ncbi:MAG: hypothetical protein AAF170_16985, partial [Bacteroidota bacterium]
GEGTDMTRFRIGSTPPRPLSKPGLLRALSLLTCMVLLIGVPASGCGEGRNAEQAAVDSSLVHVLVDLHLADARGAVRGESSLSDSLRDLVYEHHGWDSTRLDQRLTEVALEADAVAALTEAVESQLALEQQPPAP